MALNIGYAVQEIGFYTQMLACHNVKYSQVKSSSLDLIISKCVSSFYPLTRNMINARYGGCDS